MEWDYVKPLLDECLIDRYEQMVGYRFPAEFRKCALEHNAGYPAWDCIDTDRCKERVFSNLLSFNPDDTSTIWDPGMGLDETDEECMELMQNYVTFAESPFGDPICFDRRDDSVVYIDHETLLVEHVAPSFQALLEKLYEIEDEDEENF